MPRPKALRRLRLPRWSEHAWSFIPEVRKVNQNGSGHADFITNAIRSEECDGGYGADVVTVGFELNERGFFLCRMPYELEPDRARVPRRARPRHGPTDGQETRQSGV